jgi:hypothetical protein
VDDAADRCESAPAGHLYVDERDIGSRERRGVNGLLGVFDDADDVEASCERDAQHGPCYRIVIGDQQGDRRVGGSIRVVADAVHALVIVRNDGVL